MDRTFLACSLALKHYDFFIVTVSRLFYYCGMSVQTFFLYFLKLVGSAPSSKSYSAASFSKTASSFFEISRALGRSSGSGR